MAFLPTPSRKGGTPGQGFRSSAPYPNGQCRILKPTRRGSQEFLPRHYPVPASPAYHSQAQRRPCHSPYYFLMPFLPFYHVIPSVAEESRRPITSPLQSPHTPQLKSFEGARGNFYKSSPAVSPIPNHPFHPCHLPYIIPMSFLPFYHVIPSVAEESRRHPSTPYPRTKSHP